jgi:hypothetical protein
MPIAGEDTAAALIALYVAQGALGTQNNIGTVTSTAANNLPDPTVAAYNKAVLSTPGAASFVLPAPSIGKRLQLLLQQDTTGSRTATVTPSTGTLKWVGAAAPTLTTTGGRQDILTFECYDGTTFVGSSKLNIG